MQEVSGARPVYCTTGLEIIKVPAPEQLCDGLWCSYCVSGTSVGAGPWGNRSGLCVPCLDNRKWPSCNTSASLLVPGHSTVLQKDSKKTIIQEDSSSSRTCSVMPWAKAFCHFRNSFLLSGMLSVPWVMQWENPTPQAQLKGSSCSVKEITMGQRWETIDRKLWGFVSILSKQMCRFLFIFEEWREHFMASKFDP